MGQGRDRGYASGCQLHSFAFEFGTDTNMMISLVTFADQLLVHVIVSKNTFFAVNNPILNKKEAFKFQNMSSGPRSLQNGDITKDRYRKRTENNENRSWLQIKEKTKKNMYNRERERERERERKRKRERERERERERKRERDRKIK